MVTGLGCRLCKNNWGKRRISYYEGNILVTVYVCEVCGQGKTDYECFKLICSREGREEA